MGDLRMLSQMGLVPDFVVVQSVRAVLVDDPDKEVVHNTNLKSFLRQTTRMLRWPGPASVSSCMLWQS